MPQNKTGSTVAIPLPLLFITILLGLFRGAIGVSDYINPPQAVESINWQQPAQNNSDKSDKSKDGKPILYNFTADWCGPCHVIEATAFSNRDIVRYINQNFVPVRVVDRQVEDGSNLQTVAALERKFNVSAYPTLIVALPSGSRVDYEQGFRSANGTYDFLKRSVRKLDYERGMVALTSANYPDSARYLKRWLASTQGKTGNSDLLYGALYCALAYEHAGDDQAAKKVLSEFHDKVQNHDWPYPLVQFALGEISQKQLLQRAAHDTDKQTEAEYLSGAMLLKAGKPLEAKGHFKWVEENGTKTFYEYTLSVAELKKLP